jgi:hypothetical protein
MLICCVCGKVIANVDPNNVRYGGCSSCDLDLVKEQMEKIYPDRYKKKEEKNV